MNVESRYPVMRQARALCSLGALFSGLVCTSAHSSTYADWMQTEAAVSQRPSGSILAAEQGCDFGMLSQPLGLQEAVERALCQNPKTNEAWAGVKAQAAGVGMAEGGFLPTMSASWQSVHDRTISHITNEPSLSSEESSTQLTKSISLNWVLYDFGGRSAALANANALLSAALANQDATLQSTFATVTKDYYAAQAADGTLSAAREVEKTAEDAFKAATERVGKGVAPISDELQAHTAYAQAVLSRAKASGDRQVALGTLASDMGMAPQTPIGLPEVGAGVAPAVEFRESVALLIDEAMRTHPSVLAAQAQLDAAEAKARQLEAGGRPTISVLAKASSNNLAVSPGLGLTPMPALGRDTYIGVQVTIPLFEGFTRMYQVRQAEMQGEVQRATVLETKQKVGLDVWSSYHSLDTATENIGNSAMLLEIAQQSYDAADHRYKAGVGNILELLNAQTSLANAKKQRIQALTDWRTARLQLAGALGQLGMQSLDAAH